MLSKIWSTYYPMMSIYEYEEAVQKFLMAPFGIYFYL